MYCKNCGKEIDDNSLYCNICGAKQHIETNTAINYQNVDNISNNAEVYNSDDTTVTRRKTKQKAIVSLSIVFVLLIVIIIGVIGYRNSFNSTINTDSFTYEYLIKDDKIEVELTANVDIKDFKFSIFCYRTENILHQYHKYFEEEFISKGSTKKYTITMSEIFKESPYLEKWKLNTVKITDYRGKIRNKDK